MNETRNAVPAGFVNRDYKVVRGDDKQYGTAKSAIERRWLIIKKASGWVVDVRSTKAEAKFYAYLLATR